MVLSCTCAKSALFFFFFFAVPEQNLSVTPQGERRRPCKTNVFSGHVQLSTLQWVVFFSVVE